MKNILYFKVDNDLGEKLSCFVQKICERKGMRFSLPKRRVDRGDMLAAQIKADLIILDCSVEHGHIYKLLTEWIKTSKKFVILSRTALPQNVATYYQFAPIHGHSLCNDVLAEWLEHNFDFILKRVAPSAFLEHKDRSEYDFGMFRWSYEYFLSFRGSHATDAHNLSEYLRQQEGASVRIVLEGQYAYEFECMTLQQMWGVMAQLMRDMSPTKRILLCLSEDYLDSFWTTSELLLCLREGGRKNSFIKRTFARKTDGTLMRVTTTGEDYCVPPLTFAQSHRMFQIRVNSDPYSLAPETQASPKGYAKILAMILRPTFGYYTPEFTSNYWYNLLWVQCPNCRPRKRKNHELNWQRHLAFWVGKSKGEPTNFDHYFGYFSLSSEKLRQSHKHCCPNCKTTIQLVNRHPPRTLWMPIQTTEHDQTREVIVKYPVWEVVTEH